VAPRARKDTYQFGSHGANLQPFGPNVVTIKYYLFLAFTPYNNHLISYLSIFIHLQFAFVYFFNSMITKKI
jgi:hypothetical protein